MYCPLPWISLNCRKGKKSYLLFDIRNRCFKSVVNFLCFENIHLPPSSKRAFIAQHFSFPFIFSSMTLDVCLDSCCYVIATFQNLFALAWICNPRCLLKWIHILTSYQWFDKGHAREAVRLIEREEKETFSPSMRIQDHVHSYGLGNCIYKCICKMVLDWKGKGKEYSLFL